MPLYDQTYSEAFEEWEAERLEFEADPEPGYSFEEWHGSSPDPEYYRPEWSEEPSHYQIYEDVTEGTPASPVFASLEEMETWLFQKGFSRKAIAEFTRYKWAPSFVLVNGAISGIGIHSYDLLVERGEPDANMPALQ